MTIISELVQTRLAVLALSQAAGWIPQIGADEIGMLAFVLPRTATAASVQLACSIACYKHDEAVGAGNYHLFRLATPLEERISRVLNGYKTKALPNTELIAAIAYLEQLSEGMAIDSREGPVQTGLYSDLAYNTIDSITCLAKHYLLAYQQGYQTFPYLS